MVRRRIGCLRRRARSAEHCGHLGVDWVSLTLCPGRPDNSSLWVPLKEAHQFDCPFCKALVSKQQRKHDETDDKLDQHYRNVGLRLSLRTTFSSGYHA